MKTMNRTTLVARLSDACRPVWSASATKRKAMLLPGARGGWDWERRFEKRMKRAAAVIFPKDLPLATADAYRMVLWRWINNRMSEYGTLEIGCDSGGPILLGGPPCSRQGAVRCRYPEADLLRVMGAVRDWRSGASHAGS